jgi:hypothetical protein
MVLWTDNIGSAAAAEAGRDDTAAACPQELA